MSKTYGSIEALTEGEQIEIMETEGRKRPAGAREVTRQKWGSVKHGCQWFQMGTVLHFGCDKAITDIANSKVDKKASLK